MHPLVVVMRVPALMRQSLAGRLIYHASGRRIWQYDEEKPDYVFPARYARLLKKKKSEAATLVNEDVNNSNPPEARKEGDTMKEGSAPKDVNKPTSDEVQEEPRHSAVLDASELRVSKEHVHQPVGNTQDIEKGVAPDAPKVHQDDPFVVTWDSPDDPENPRNWSFPKRCFVTFSICLLTFSIYIGSAIYSPGILSISDQYHISPVAGSLGITLFVLGYGLGPMVLSPLSEIPQIGRTTVYIVSLLLFVLLQIPTALAKNLGTLLPLRFLAGFVGSPALATGGASLTDMWADEWRAVPMGLWGVAAVSGPVLGPVVGGFAVMAEGWTWTIWILMWLSGTSLVFLAVFLPETSSQALLYRRAVRIRRLTGDTRFKSKGEIEAENMKISEVAKMTLVRLFVLCFTEPIVLFWNIYIALVYGILYIFITSFDVVFIENHGFNLGENGLAFLGLIVGVTITYALYALWAVRVLRPMYANGTFTPEKRLPVAMVGAVLFPISMFWFGWTSAPSIHWILPIIGSAIFAGATFCLFSAGINYLPDCYPRHVASILAGNDLVRSCVGAAFPLFSTAFFHNLGVGPACSVLGGIAVLMMPLPFVLYRYGEKIRSWSKYAN